MTQRRLAIYAVVLVGLGAAFSYGTLVGAKQVFPYDLLKSGWNVVETITEQDGQDANLAHTDSVPARYRETDVVSLIDIEDLDGVAAKRKDLIRFLWGANGPPMSALPDSIEKGIQDDRYNDLTHLAGIDRLTVEMEWTLQSIAYLFRPTEPSGRLVVYHQGHAGDFVHGKPLIAALLREGYAVLGLAMPLEGMNNKPIVRLPRFGRLKIEKHDHMKFLRPANGSPVRYFLEPVLVVINYAQSQGYTSIDMMGISGGGWTTTLAAAIDERISRSYPVAGTLPIYLRSDPDDNAKHTWGDYEQTVPELYEVANYLEIYILSAAGLPNRRQVQILNKYDAACLDGVGYRSYEQIVAEQVEQFGEGGLFRVFLDNTHREHKISERAIAEILQDLQR